MLSSVYEALFHMSTVYISSSTVTDSRSLTVCLSCVAAVQVLVARQIYDEQLPIITKVSSAAIVGLLKYIASYCHAVSIPRFR